jgi:hypothetical protein
MVRTRWREAGEHMMAHRCCRPRSLSRARPEANGVVSA